MLYLCLIQRGKNMCMCISSCVCAYMYMYVWTSFVYPTVSGDEKKPHVLVFDFVWHSLFIVYFSKHHASQAIGSQEFSYFNTPLIREVLGLYIEPEYCDF